MLDVPDRFHPPIRAKNARGVQLQHVPVHTLIVRPMHNVVVIFVVSMMRSRLFNVSHTTIRPSPEAAIPCGWLNFAKFGVPSRHPAPLPPVNNTGVEPPLVVTR